MIKIPSWLEVRMHRFRSSMRRTIRSFSQNAVAGEAHLPENEMAQDSLKSRIWAQKTPKGPESGPFDAPHHYGSLSNVQQILAGKLGLVGDERESRLGLGAHQPLDRVSGALAVVGHRRLKAKRSWGRGR